MFIDDSGNDTLVVHRSPRLESMNDGDADIYLVTFSLIQNGVEKSLDEVMYMYGDKEADKEGDNGLHAKSSYKLSWDQLSHHRGDKGWENTIRITDFGSFFHPVVNTQDFEGCYGLNEEKPNKLSIGSSNYYSLDWQNSKDALKDLRKMYDDANGGANGNKLTGDKFILKSRSTAPIEKLSIRNETPLVAPLKKMELAN
jgi:hypothetical protein